ncbi:hypothetical protein QBC40DRAFT_283123 [Triangularia verruculosa]|uniref:Uncharacterized protein n=1 Tax=Triangularia verruculosa TaxID=2587418 RepID=A0AAN6XE06_9PEZI|nr:hypothetical protein QBC40DRAFT_283123 [Triangularia verruculosa]
MMRGAMTSVPDADSPQTQRKTKTERAELVGMPLMYVCMYCLCIPLILFFPSSCSLCRDHRGIVWSFFFFFKVPFPGKCSISKKSSVCYSPTNLQVSKDFFFLPAHMLTCPACQLALFPLSFLGVEGVWYLVCPPVGYRLRRISMSS